MTTTNNVDVIQFPTGNEFEDLLEFDKSEKKFSPGLLARKFIDSDDYRIVGNRIYHYSDGYHSEKTRNDLLDDIREEFDDRSVKSSQVREVRDLIMMDKSVKINEDQLNADQDMINLINGMYSISRNQLLPHDRKYLSTNRIPVEYDKTKQINKFQVLLDQLLPDKLDQQRLQEAFGYSLSTYHEAEKMFLYTGRPRTGKSTMIRIQEKLIGKANLSNLTLQQAADKFNTGHLNGKLANTNSDLPDVPIKETGTLKMIISGDRMKGEFKGENSFFFSNKSKLIFASNHIPTFLNESSEAMLRRFEVIEFNEVIPESQVDPFLINDIEKELDAIFNWAMDGLRRLINNLFQFTKSPKQQQYLDKFKMKNNSVSYFIEHHCKIGSNEVVPKTFLYNAYCQFCEDNILKRISKTKFYEALQSKCPQVSIKQVNSRNNERCFVGISLL